MRGRDGPLRSRPISDCSRPAAGAGAPRGDTNSLHVRSQPSGFAHGVAASRDRRSGSRVPPPPRTRASRRTRREPRHRGLRQIGLRRGRPPPDEPSALRADRNRHVGGAGPLRAGTRSGDTAGFMSPQRPTDPAPFSSLYTHGFARVAVAVPRVRVAEPEFNAQRTLALARRASESHAAVVIFPELGLSAYSNEDLFRQQTMTEAVAAVIERIMRASATLSPVIVVGAPLRAEAGLFNTAIVIHRGADSRRGAEELSARVPGVLRKAPVPSGPRPRSGDQVQLVGETVPFGADLLFASRDLPGFALHVEICEDLWAPIPPSTYAALAGATVLANLSGEQHHDRQGRLPSQAVRRPVGPDDRRPTSTPPRARANRQPTWPGTARRLIYENGDLLAEIRAVPAGRAADPRRPRPRPHRLGSLEHEQLWRLDPRSPRPAGESAPGRVRAWRLQTMRSRCSARSSASPTCRPIQRSRSERCEEVYNIQVARARDRDCGRPGSRRS